MNRCDKYRRYNTEFRQKTLPFRSNRRFCWFRQLSVLSGTSGNSVENSETTNTHIDEYRLGQVSEPKCSKNWCYDKYWRFCTKTAVESVSKQSAGVCFCVGNSHEPSHASQTAKINNYSRNIPSQDTRCGTPYKNSETVNFVLFVQNTERETRGHSAAAQCIFSQKMWTTDNRQQTRVRTGSLTQRK